jgi:SAM-dependent methyltransferase
MPNAADSTQRFSNRVDNYVRYRLGYPPEVIHVLKRDAGLKRDHVVADIGSGTGISTKLFLDYGSMVYGVEPNQAMRSAAEKSFAGNSRFHSVDGTAENTTLAVGSVDVVVAGQAFHWFDRPKTRAEFSRILRSGGYVVLMWNTRRTESTAFLRDYEKLICDFASDYRQVDHRNIDEAKIQSFFAPSQFQYRGLDNKQTLDCAGLIGRLASSSYMPSESHPQYAAMTAAAERLFEQYANSDRVEIDYDLELYFGQLD